MEAALEVSSYQQGWYNFTHLQLAALECKRIWNRKLTLCATYVATNIYCSLKIIFENSRVFIKKFPYVTIWREMSS